MRSLATPQKSKPGVVPTEDDVAMATNGEDVHGGHDDVGPAHDPSKTRKNMCTPDKASTPVKSPFYKKGRVGSAKKGVEDEMTPDAMETTSPVKSLTLEYDPDVAAAQYAPWRMGRLEVRPTCVKDRHVRNMPIKWCKYHVLVEDIYDTG